MQKSSLFLCHSAELEYVSRRVSSVDQVANFPAEILVARHEQDREDILREATALIERVELQLPAYAEPVTVGFRRDGSISFFIGADPVFQFNSACELRRAYLDGRLIKAERGQLVSLQRQRTTTQVELRSTLLDAAASADLIAMATQHLRQLADHLRQKTYQVNGQVPPSVDVVARVRQWLEDLTWPIAVARRPHAG